MQAAKTLVFTAESFFEEFIPDVFEEIRQAYSEEIEMGKLSNLKAENYFRKEFLRLLRDKKVDKVIILNRSGKYEIPEVVEIKTGDEFLDWVEWYAGKNLVEYIVFEEDEYEEED